MAFAQDVRPSEESLSLTPPETDAPSDEGSVPTGIGGLIRMLLILLLIVVAIYGVVVLIRRSGRAKYESELIRIYAAQATSGNKMLYLVGVGAHVYFLSAGDNDIRLIAEISDKETKDTIRLQGSEGRPPKGSFAKALSRILTPRRSSTDDDTPSDVEEKMSLLKGQNEKLERM